MPEDETLSKAELTMIDKIVGAVGLSKLRNTLLKKVRQAFEHTFHGTQLEYDFVRATPDERALKYLQDRIFILSEKTQDKLRGDLRWELLEGMQNTESIDEIKRRIDKIFEGNTVNTERIARTETLNAMNAGRLGAYEASGIVGYKEWRAAINNPRTAADSKRLHGQLQVLSDPFIDPKTGDAVMHPPNRPNCRCAMIPLRKLPENIVYKGGQMYAADEMIGKIEIDITSLQKSEKRIWIKPTSKRKGHYRKVKGAKPKEEVKEVAEKPGVSEMVPDNVKEIISLNDMGVEGGLHEDVTHIVKFEDSSNAIYKTMNQEAVFGEVSAYNISKIIGWDIIPETSSGNYGKGEGSVQRWIPYSEGYITKDIGVYNYAIVNFNEKHIDGLAKIFVLDAILGLYDRHQTNIAIQGEKVYAIDNERFGGHTRAFLSGSTECDFALEELTRFRAYLPTLHDNSRMIHFLRLVQNVKDLELKFAKSVDKEINIIVKHKKEIIKYYDNNIHSVESGHESFHANSIEKLSASFVAMEEYIASKLQVRVI